MLIKTNELTGDALDWAVAQCESMVIEIRPAGACGRPLYVLAAKQGYTPWVWKPSTDWSEAGPIIEREWLDVTPWPNQSREDMRWQCKQHDSIDCVTFGPTPLIAAMRCFVASKLGDEVEVPDSVLRPETNP